MKRRAKSPDVVTIESPLVALAIGMLERVAGECLAEGTTPGVIRRIESVRNMLRVAAGVAS